MRDQEREVAVAERQVGGGVDGVHAGVPARGRDVDGADTRVRVGGAHEAAFERLVVDVVGEAAGATQQARVLAAFDAFADPAGGQLVPLPSGEGWGGAVRLISAARRTALRMLA